MSGAVRQCLVFFLMGFIWVFLLSIEFENKPLFIVANRILVKNPIVDALDKQLHQSYREARQYAKSALSNARQEASEAI